MKKMLLLATLSLSTLALATPGTTAIQGTVEETAQVTLHVERPIAITQFDDLNLGSAIAGQKLTKVGKSNYAYQVPTQFIGNDATHTKHHFRIADAQYIDKNNQHHILAVEVGNGEPKRLTDFDDDGTGIVHLKNKSGKTLDVLVKSTHNFKHTIPGDLDEIYGGELQIHQNFVVPANTFAGNYTGTMVARLTPKF